MNILVTSAGRRAYLIRYFKEALGDTGKVFASNSEFSVALQEADGYFISPLIYDDNYVRDIVVFCKKNDISAIISVFDIDLLVLAKAKEFIEGQGIKLLLSDAEVVEICNDKWRTCCFLRENNIPVPLTFKTLDDVIGAINMQRVGFPIIVKPRWGAASKGIYEAASMEELEVFYKRSLRDVEESFLKYESQFTPAETIIFQEKLTGQEYGLDIVSDLEGNFVGVFPKSKVRMRAGETDLGQTVSPAKFLQLAKALSRKLRHRVILSVDCFVSGEAVYVLELNCRISGHYPLSHLAGVDLPRQIIEWLDGQGTDMGHFQFTEGLYITKDLLPVVLKKVD